MQTIAYLILAILFANGLTTISSKSAFPSKSPDWGKLPNYVCMQGGELFATRHSISSSIIRDDSGERSYTIPMRTLSAPFFWRSQLILAWFSCEGNLHHFMAQTLHPIANTLDELDGGGGIDKPVIAIVASEGLGAWKTNTTHEQGCHGSAFYPMFSVLGVDPLLFSFPIGNMPGGVQLNGGGVVFPDWNQDWDNTSVYCFHSTQQVKPEGRSGTLHRKLLDWSGCVTTPHPRLVIIQRKLSRRVINVGALVSVAQEMFPLMRVSIAVLEDLTVSDQLNLIACGSVIVAGAQGAGLQWTSFWDPTGARSALIEWGWREWPAFYAGRVARGTFRMVEELVEPCLVPRREEACCCPGVDPHCMSDGRLCPWPTKSVDIVVSIESWKQDLAQMVALLQIT